MCPSTLPIFDNSSDILLHAIIGCSPKEASLCAQESSIIRPIVLQACLGARPATSGRRDPRLGHKDRGFGTACSVGLDPEKRFHRYHRVLSCAAWSSREAARVRWGLLVETFVSEDPFVLGVNKTLERKRKKKIAAKGIYRDLSRSSHQHFVKASALHWAWLG